MRSLPRKNRGRERFAVLYRVAAFVALGGRCLCNARCIARSPASFGFRRSKLQNTTTTSSHLLFFLLASHIEQSIVFSPEDPIKFKVDRALVGATSFFTELTDGCSLQYVNLVLHKHSSIINGMKKREKCLHLPYVYTYRSSFERTAKSKIWLIPQWGGEANSDP